MLTQFDSMQDGHIGLIEAVQHEIKLEKMDSRTIQSAAYCTGPETRQVRKEEVDQLLIRNAILPVQTERTSELLFFWKNDGTLHFSVIYEKLKLNAVTISDLYPIQCKDECIESLCETTVLLTLQTNRRYR